MRAVKYIDFCAAHRLMGHEGACANLHGHNYKVAFHTEADELDEVGRVVDFSVIKKIMKEWIDRNWDHGAVLNENDSEILKALYFQTSMKVYRMEGNPTAENMARVLLRAANDNLEVEGVRVVRVDVWETETSFATAEL